MYPLGRQTDINRQSEIYIVIKTGHTKGQAGMQTDSQAYRKTDRQTDRQTLLDKRQNDGHTEKHTDGQT